MPNTLVHLGLQGLGSRLISRKIDLKWVFLGCIIPDLPWIFRRLINSVGMPVDVYDLRVYAVVQASLLFCLLLSAAFALLSARPRIVFLILSTNAVFHLLLDSVEKKWGNGVHFFAPVDWQHKSLGWLWPDSLPLAILSGLSLLILIWWFVRPGSESVRVNLKPGWRFAIVFSLLVTYLFAPLFLKQGPYGADINSVATLQARDERIGKTLFMDRETYIRKGDQDHVLTFAKEPLRVTGDVRATRSSEITLIAEFVGVDEIRIIELYEFQYAWRDSATLLGLFLALIYWLVALVREQKTH